MSSMAQETDSNDLESCKMKKKSEKTRRKWSDKEEEVFLASLKELIAQGWKSDNGFRTGYLNKLEEAMKKEFPGTDLKAQPNIYSKITGWKRSYSSLTTILSQSGVGFNLRGTHMIDRDNEKWEQIVKKDGNAKGMRYKPWPMLEDWKEKFGNDRATGENAEDIFEAVRDIDAEEHLAGSDIGNDYHVNLDDILQNDAHEDSVCQSEQRDQPPRQKGKKRKAEYEIHSVCNLLSQMHQDTNARLENLASRIGYDADLGKARKKVFDQLGDIPDLSLNDKFDVYEILADKVERLEIFMGMPAESRPQYVMRLLKTKEM